MLLLRNLFSVFLLLSASTGFSLTVPLDMGTELNFVVDEEALSTQGAVQFAVQYLDTKAEVDSAVASLDIRGFTASSELMVFYIKVAKLLKGIPVHHFCDELLTSEPFFDRLIETQDVKKIGAHEFLNTLHLGILGIPIQDISYQANLEAYQQAVIPPSLLSLSSEDSEVGSPEKLIYMEGKDNGELLGGLTLVGKMIDKGEDTLVIAYSFIALKKSVLGRFPRSIIKRVGPGRMRDTIFYMLGQLEQGTREANQCQH